MLSASRCHSEASSRLSALSSTPSAFASPASRPSIPAHFGRARRRHRSRGLSCRQAPPSSQWQRRAGERHPLSLPQHFPVLLSQAQNLLRARHARKMGQFNGPRVFRFAFAASWRIRTCASGWPRRCSVPCQAVFQPAGHLRCSQDSKFANPHSHDRKRPTWRRRGVRRRHQEGSSSSRRSQCFRWPCRPTACLSLRQRWCCKPRERNFRQEPR